MTDPQTAAAHLSLADHFYNSWNCSNHRTCSSTHRLPNPKCDGDSSFFSRSESKALDSQVQSFNQMRPKLGHNHKRSHSLNALLQIAKDRMDSPHSSTHSPHEHEEGTEASRNLQADMLWTSGAPEAGTLAAAKADSIKAQWVDVRFRCNEN